MERNLIEDARDDSFLLHSSMALLSWNLNSFRPHFEDLHLLMVELQPLFSCLQDTHLLPEHHLYLHRYACYRNDTDDGFHAHNGIAILVHYSVHSQEIALQSILPVVAFKVKMILLSLIVCSLYLPPGQPFSATDLLDLFSELPTPFIIVGDLNDHNSIWGSSRTCQSGALLGPLLLAHNLVLLNPGKPTHFCMGTGSTYSIDLTLCSRSIAPHLDWTVLSDLQGSDHFPVIIQISIPRPALQHAPHWILARADWAEFRASIHTSDESFEDVRSMAQHFPNAILTAAKASIPQSSGTIRHSPVPWLNPDYAVAIRARKRALTLL